MSIYDLTYSKLGKQLLPPDKRNTKLIAFVTNLLAPMQWLRDLWLGNYRTGTAAVAVYDSSTIFNKYDQAVYNNAVYSSLQNNNMGTTPAVGSAWWVVVQTNFIGTSERLLYNGQCIILTWALNKWFHTNFVQPSPKAASVVQQISGIVTISCPAHGFTTGQQVYLSFGVYNWFTGYFQITVIDANTFTCPSPGPDFVPTVSDDGFAFALSGIYIQNNFVANTSPFRVGVTEAESSVVYTGKSSDFVTNTYSFTGQINFTIYIPAATYAIIADTDTARRATVSAFVNQYLPAGLLYSILPY